jgi:hypothetical protein
MSKYRQHYQPKTPSRWWEVVMTFAVFAFIGVMLAL